MNERAAAPLLAIALVSAASMAWEILLLRLFSITQFHHTAHMVISLALLGFAASGVVLTRFGAAWRRSFDRVLPLLVLAVAPAIVVSFAVAQWLMVFPDQMLWEPRLALRLLLLYFVLALPFLFVGSAIGLTMTTLRPTRVYAWDLVGAGLGSVLIVALLTAFAPSAALRMVAGLACAAAGVALWRSGRRAAILTVAISAMILWMLPAAWTAPRMSPYKGLRQALRVEGARVATERSSPLALVSVLENDLVPLRHAPGLSLAAKESPGPQIGLFLDGDALTAIPRVGGGERLAYLEATTAALPYSLGAPRSVVVLGAGGGEGVLRAVRQGAERVVAVEIDRQVVSLVRDEYDDFTGGLYRRAEVEVAVADIRGFMAREERRWELIEHVALGGFGGGGLALASLSEDYVKTVEAIESYLERLAPDGLLAMTTWVRNPPRPTVRLVAALIEAMEGGSPGSPRDRLVVIRSWQTATSVVKNGTWSAEEIERLRRFCAERYFDLVYYPDMDEREADRYNRLGGPILHRAVHALLGPQRRAFVESYPFDVRAPRDDRPYFHQFFRWASLRGILEARGRGGLPLLEAGYLVLVVTLGQAVVAGLVLVVVPWTSLRRRGVSIPFRQGLFFAALGLGFLLVEIAYLQRFMLFLYHPILTAAVVIASFLVFAGLGSAAVRGRGRDPAAITRAAAAIGIIGGVEHLALPLVAPTLAAAGVGWRIAAAVVLIAPMAFVMGRPFPLALARLRERAPETVPWAWGTNACASVISPIVATMVAVHLGFAVVVVLALVTYAFAAALAHGAFR